MAWNDPSTWVPNTVLTAADLNREVRDNFDAIGDSSAAYTPIWGGTTTAPTIGNGTLAAGYNLAGKRLWFWISVTLGSTTTVGAGTYSFSLPVGLTPIPGRNMLTGSLVDTSASATYPLFGFTSGSIITLRVLSTTAGGPLVACTPTVPFTFANGDQIFIAGDIEVT